MVKYFKSSEPKMKGNTAETKNTKLTNTEKKRNETTKTNELYTLYTASIVLLIRECV
jgi:hypothetical protein